MSKRRNVAHVAEISVFAHATEDPDKALAAAQRLLPSLLAERTVFARVAMEGHHRNPILQFEAVIEERKDGIETLRKLLADLSSVDEDLLRKEFLKNVDRKGNIYLRFDKQQAFLGKTVLGSGDPVSFRFRLGFRLSSLEELKALLEAKRDA